MSQLQRGAGRQPLLSLDHNAAVQNYAVREAEVELTRRRQIARRECERRQEETDQQTEERCESC